MTSDDDLCRASGLCLAWAQALSQAVLAVADQHHVPHSLVDPALELDVSAGLAAGMLAFAETAEQYGLTWSQAAEVARHELAELRQLATSQ